jgi:hypothetical protein
MFKKFFGLLAIVPAVFLLSCSSGDSDKFPDTVVVKQGDPVAQALPSEIVVGENRFTYFVLDSDGVPVVDAETTISFYDLSNGEEVKKSTLDGESLVPGRDAGLEEQIIHTHADGSRHVHINAGGQIGLYAVNTNFDKAGLWGAELKVRGGTPEVNKDLILMFDVIEEGTIPNIGDPAPPSDNLTAADVTDLALIDTSPEPSVEMHELSIADAVASGKPTVVLFAAPGYCTSQICGPEFEIMKKLYGQYQGKDVNFVHVEFYQDPATPQLKRPVAAAAEWNLRTEPWFFVIDASGKIAARFEGPTGLSELDAAIKKVSF